MTSRTGAAIDLGTRFLRVATARGVRPVPVREGSAAEVARVATAAADGPESLCVAVPDDWISGDRAGAGRLEDARHACEDVARLGRVRWTGQLAAICAYASATAGPGRYLVCDAGASGVRAGAFTLADGTIRIEATRVEADGGWAEFDAAVRAGLPASQGEALPATWHREAQAASGERAWAVLQEALATGDADSLDARVYRIAGAGGDITLTARIIIDAFAETGRGIAAAIASVSGASRAGPGHVVIGGGMGWLPLVARAVALAAGLGAAPGGEETMPGENIVVVGPDAAALGALGVARDEIRLAPPAGLHAVSVPVHRVLDGQLQEVSVTLPWSEPFASFPGGALTVDNEELRVTVGGQPRVALLAGLLPGLYEVGLRPTWPGPGLLVVRPAHGDGAPRIVALADLAAR
ncbi:MAG TPA: hypothetical protein VH478_01205 [Trebonia sp.]|nr:hypothetical protein [Trebonia sp.]